MILSCVDAESRAAAIPAALAAIKAGALVVLPTDTVYGVGADAFNPQAVHRLLQVKGRTRQMPPPVLIPSIDTVSGLAREVSAAATSLMEAFWPGGLTIIVPAQLSLAWDLGETQGTVALRVPDHPGALALLAETGPLAVSSANLTGLPAAKTIAQAQSQLQDGVVVYLDAGELSAGPASTIVDATGELLRVARPGVISTAELIAVAGIEAFAETDTHGVAEPESEGQEDSEKRQD